MLRLLAGHKISENGMQCEQSTSQASGCSLL